MSLERQWPRFARTATGSKRIGPLDRVSDVRVNIQDTDRTGRRPSCRTIIDMFLLDYLPLALFALTVAAILLKPKS